MTSPYDYMSNNWVTIAPSANDEYEKLYTLLRSFNITPKEFLTYSTLRAFLLACGIPTEQPIAFHNGRCVGTYDDVENYLSGKGLKIHEANAG